MANLGACYLADQARDQRVTGGKNEVHRLAVFADAVEGRRREATAKGRVVF
jgi:hypothetical protein